MGMKVIEIDKKREELIEIAKKYTWFNNGHEQSVYEEPGKISVSQSGNYFTDILGNTYLEALGGFAGCTLGRSNSYIIEAMVEELKVNPIVISGGGATPKANFIVEKDS